MSIFTSRTRKCLTSVGGAWLIIVLVMLAAIYTSPTAAARQSGAQADAASDGGQGPPRDTVSSSASSDQAVSKRDLPAPQLVKEINPGNASSVPEMFVQFDQTVYFRANDGKHGVELWRTDGTSAGTSLVADLFPGPLNGVPGNLAVAGGSLYFHAFTEPTGSKVFRSDGTRAGTQLLVDTFPGAPGGPSGPPLPGAFTTFGERVLFAATDPQHGYELWRTDGTGAGTALVKDIHPGRQWSVPVGLLPFAGKAFFGADDSVISNPDGTATFNRELFVTDGTASGTSRLIDINPGPQPSIPILLTRFGKQFLFRANDGTHGDELWISDGTATGTRMLADINLRGRSLPDHLTVAGDRVFFSADDGVRGAELWVTDGTGDGTQIVKDINPSGSSNPMRFTRLGDRIVFAADDGQNGSELWVSDGTPAGTQLVKDVNAGAGNSSPLELVAVGGSVFFTAIADADETTKTVRTQLWATDGTEEGTKLVWEAPGRFPGYTIRNLTLLGRQLLFSAPTAADAEGLSANIELYRLDVNAGKPPGTVPPAGSVKP